MPVNYATIKYIKSDLVEKLSTLYHFMLVVVRGDTVNGIVSPVVSYTREI